MDTITTDVRAIAAHGCPITIDPHPTDGYVEIVIGEIHGRGPAIRIALCHLTDCHALANAAMAAREMFLQNPPADPALSQLDTSATTTTSHVG